MTLALDHAPAALLHRFLHALRSWLAALHRYWFVDCVLPSDPRSSLSTRDWADLPTWHPTVDE